jgi:hypothetical protein
MDSHEVDVVVEIPRGRRNKLYRTLENGPTPQVLRRLDAREARDVVERGRQRVG